MADAKISQLPVATTPLAGTELVPIVQGGTTDQTTVQAILTSAVPSGTANGVLYLNGSKVVTSGSALTFDGTSALGLKSNNASTFAYFDVGRTASDARTAVAAAVNDFLTGTAAGDALFYKITAGNVFYGTAGAGAAIFTINNSEQMRLTSTGLGIGTSSADIFGIGGGRIIGLQGSTSVSFQMFQGAKGFYALATASNVILRGYLAPLNIETQGSNEIIFRTDVVERARIDASGNVIINTAAIATNATDGFLYVPTCAGTPTGTPTTYTGRSPIVIDTTNNKLYFYSGGQWRDAGP